jgi:outer membrane PBP1 activator LpoA protein
MYFQTIKSKVLPPILLCLLASCSTKKAPIDNTLDLPIPSIETKVADPKALTPEQRVELAKTLPTNAAVNELIGASKLFYQQSNYPKALWLADKTIPLIDEEVSHHTHVKVQLGLIKASSLQQLAYFAESKLELEKIEQFSNDNNIVLSATYYRLLSTSFKHDKNPVAALNAQLFAFSLTSKNTETQLQIETIWHDFQRLSQWQLNLLALDKAPDSKGWLQLTLLANKFGANQEQMLYHLTMWQKKFKTHPANIIAAQLLQQKISIKVIKNIAVIIPLSGKLHSEGLAIQQGVMASFANDENKTLHFLDSNTVNWYGLTNELSTKKIDYVIGPLLKSNVDKYIRHTSAQEQSQNDEMLDAASGLFDLNKSNDVTDTSIKSSMPSIGNITAIDSDLAIKGYLEPTTNAEAIPTLFLNMPAKATLTPKHTIFSMRPEDEAIQAAATLSKQNFKRPIILSKRNKVSKRIAQTFTKQWQHLTGNDIDVVYYDSGTQMQANIKASLAVDKSNARINKLKGRLNQNIKSQTRNRRDIDMIYLIGTPEQTRLVKPYIEVNISPFSEVIPVFSSSRSHSTKNDYSSSNDLQGLTFTEMPWLLANEQNTELAATSQQLWPKRSDGLSRLFAMGYDSYQLINKIPLMQQSPHVQHWGQTGVLKLDENNVLTRSLLWATYKRNKVTSIVME